MADKDITNVINIEDFINMHGEKDLSTNNTNKYSWSEYFNNEIVIFFYDLKRTKEEYKKSAIRETYNKLLQEAFFTKAIDEPNRMKYITMLYQLMLHTRDIVDGKGEYNLFYILLGEWVKITENLRRVDVLSKNVNEQTKHYQKKCVKIIDCLDTFAQKAIHSLVYLEGNEKPYGSWKDIKYFLNYMRCESDIGNNITNLSIFTYIITLVVKQLRLDVSAEKPSLLCKWLPREKSKKFGWIAKHIACAYYLDVLKTGTMIKTQKNTIILSNRAAERKCLTQYRQMIASLNRKIETPQIYQCAQKWQKIDFNKSVSKLTMERQSNAFKYIDTMGYIKGNNHDRLLCKENYETYLHERVANQIAYYKDTDSLPVFIQYAIEIGENESYRKRFGIATENDPISIEDNNEKEKLNKKWDDVKEKSWFKYFVSSIDTSSSMEGDPLLSALAIGCSIAEMSTLGKGVITFSEKPKWLDLSDNNKLTDMVNSLVTNKDWEMKTNIENSLKVVLERCVSNNLTPDEIEKTVLVIMTDMKIEYADTDFSASTTENIEKMFKDAGLKSQWKTPFKVPKIIFWNMFTRDRLPRLKTENNIDIITGLSPSVLQSFCQNGYDALNDCNPWSCLNAQLNIGRYEWVNEMINKTELFNGVTPLQELVDDKPEEITCENKKKSNYWWW